MARATGLTQPCAKRTRSGTPCKNPSIIGGKTCRMHGSGTKAAKAAAQRHIAELNDSAIDKLRLILAAGLDDEIVPVKVQATTALRVAKLNADPVKRVELSGPNGAPVQVNNSLSDAILHNPKAREHAHALLALLDVDE